MCEFTNRQDAQDAIEQLDNSDLQGKDWHVKPLEPTLCLVTAAAQGHHKLLTMFCRKTDRSAR